MDIIQFAKKADMQVPFDEQIGRETYQRVCGSPWSLRFADAIRAATAAQSAAQREAEEHIK